MVISFYHFIDGNIPGVATDKAAEPPHTEEDALEESNAQEGGEDAEQHVDDVMVVGKIGKRIIFFQIIWRIGINTLLLQHE